MGMQVGGSDDLNSEINVTPFVDVMLVLLVIFMITAPMMNSGVDISLPQTDAEKLEDPEGKLILSISKDQQLFLGKSQIPWVQLEEKLKSNDRVQTEKELYVEADQTLPYGVVVTAMAIAKQSGVSKVMMLTDPSNQMNPKDLDAKAGAIPTSPAAGQ